MTGISCFGWGLPRFEVDVVGVAGGLIRKRVTAFDEDETTLAVEAVRDLFARSGVDVSSISAVFFVARPWEGVALGKPACLSTETVLEAIGLAGVRSKTFPDSPDGCAAALLEAAELAGAGGGQVVLVAIHDSSRETSQPRGAGMAAAALFTADGGLKVGRPHASAAIVSGAPGVAGDCGAALILASLAHAGDGRDAPFNVAFPEGSVDPIVGAIPSGRVKNPRLPHGTGLPLSSETYAKLLSVDAARDLHEQPMGAYVSQAAWKSGSAARYRMEGVACADCKSVGFPPAPSCAGCGSTRLSPHALSGRGSIYSMTRIGRGGAPGEFALQEALSGAYYVAIVELEEGPRIAAQLACSFGAEPRIGAQVRSAFRLVYRQEGTPRYGLKFVPSQV